MRSPLHLSLLFALGIALVPTAFGHEHAQQKSRSTPATQATDFGSSGNPKAATRTFDINLRDTMRIEPDHLNVSQGETVRLRIRNTGAVEHEFVLGTKKEIIEHRDMMRAMPTMKHDDPNAVSVAPGATTEIIWHFSKPGTFIYACLIPGHWEAGMQGTVTVAATSKP